MSAAHPYLTGPGPVRSSQVIEGGLRLQFDEAVLELVFIADDVLRLEMGPAARMGRPSLATAAAQWQEAPSSVERYMEAEAWILRTPQLELRLEQQPLRLTLLRTSDASVVMAPSGQEYWRQLNDQTRVSRAAGANDCHYGLGEKTGGLDRGGRRWLMWNTDILSPDPDKAAGDPTATNYDPYYAAIPFYTQVDPRGRASGFFMDSSVRSSVDFQRGKGCGAVEWSLETGHYREYIYGGPSWERVLRCHAQLSGFMPRPPLWALGMHQCRWKRYSSQDIRNLALSQRASGMPCDSLWLDIDYMDGYRVFTFNKDLFPAPAQLAEELLALGLRLVTIVDPGVKAEPGYAVYDEGRAAGHFCRTASGALFHGQVWPGRTVFPNFHAPACRDWWSSRIADFALRSGAAGIWNDMNEPATGDLSCRSMLFHDGQNMLSQDEGHNDYALGMALATRAGLEQARPQERPFVLSRGGSAGIQRASALWMGDNCSNWDHLRQSVPMALGLGLSGVAFVGADVGGFIGRSNPELFVRWMQCASLMPFLRNHNDDEYDQYAWSFGDAVREMAAAAVRRRYRMLPWLYSCFLESSVSGLPVMRPLALADATDAVARQCCDQYMLGDSLLVAPVLQEGAAQRRVYLPRGEWADWHRPWRRQQGPCFVEVQAVLDELPIYVRTLSALPMLAKDVGSTAEVDWSHWELVSVPPQREGRRTSILWSDDHRTLAGGSEQLQSLHCLLERRGQTLHLELTAPEGASSLPQTVLWRVPVAEGREERCELDLAGPFPVRAQLPLGEAFL